METRTAARKGIIVVMNIGVIGLGLIGGSLARRLVHNGYAVTAWNRTPRPYDQARSEGIHCVDTLAELAAQSLDVIMLCNPLKAMPSILAQLHEVLLNPKVTLSDVGSVKGMVREQVREAGLADRYIGAHPMAGNELSGFEASDPSLYDDALWAITVDEDSDLWRCAKVGELISRGVGNRYIVVDDDSHDRAAALISHMPHAVSTALINQLVDDDNRNIAAALAAGSWRDMTRVALTDPERTRAMIDEDAENVEALLRSMARRLDALADVLHEGDRDGIAEFFAHGQAFRDYKAIERRHAGHDAAIHNDKALTLALGEKGWQNTLLESARRGERIEEIAQTAHGYIASVVTGLGLHNIE